MLKKDRPGKMTGNLIAFIHSKSYVNILKGSRSFEYRNHTMLFRAMLTKCMRNLFVVGINFGSLFNFCVRVFKFFDYLLICGYNVDLFVYFEFKF